jgi:hypothetical protein
MFWQVFGPAALAGGIFFAVVSGLAGAGLVVDAGGKPVGFPAVWSVTR